MNRIKFNTSAFLFFVMAIILTPKLFAEDYNRIINLEGTWKFTIGDDINWADPNWDDSDWDDVYVPSSWEDQGFHGYNGYGWYRIEFQIPKNFSSKTAVLILGFIDDVDEAYLNGKMIGFNGSFPPNYETAYSAYRKYPIPIDLLNLNGNNCLAVRVYDSQLSGGIINGDIGIYTPSELFNLQLNLAGVWKFMRGDDPAWQQPDYDDQKWKNISVPSVWEAQGYKDYNGVAWYRKTFDLPENLKNEKLVLVLGKIDDIDECYLNGKLIGNTGIIKENPFESNFSSEWSQIRGYYIPRGLLKGGENTISVRVYDGFKDGGIYEGPIGIITQDDYVSYWKNKKRKKSLWEIIFDN